MGQIITHPLPLETAILTGHHPTATPKTARIRTSPKEEKTRQRIRLKIRKKRKRMAKAPKITRTVASSRKELTRRKKRKRRSQKRS